MERAAERVETRESVAVPVASLVLAAAGAALIGVGDVVVGFRSDTADAVFMLASILGWTLVVWAVLLLGAALVSIVSCASTPRAVSRLEVAVLVATVAALAVLLATHPLWGSGSGSAPA